MTPAAPRPRRLVFAGEALVDVVMRVPGLPPRGGDILATSSQVAVGGGFNVMAAAARQGLPVLYAGGHGTGPWGELVRAALAAEGIGLLRPAEESRDTGFDVALVESDAERTFVTHLGAESISEPGSWDAVPAGPGDAVYVSGYGLVAPGPGAVLGGWAAALPAGVLLFLDPGPLAAQIPASVLDPVLARCDWLSANARESALLSGGAAAEEAALRLLARTARASVIVRDGPAGCLLAPRPRAEQTPAPPCSHSGAGRSRGGHDRGGRRALRGVPGGAGRRPLRGRRLLPGQRRGRAGGHPGRARHRPGPRRIGRLARYVVGCAELAAAFLITMTRMSCAPPVTGPAVKTSSPGLSALSVLRLPLSRTTDLLVSVQASVMPFWVRTTTSLPATDSIVPRSNASVRTPVLVAKVTWPYSPPTRRSRASRPCRRASCFAGVAAAAWVVAAAWLAVSAAGAAGEPVAASAAANAPPPTTTAVMASTAAHRRR